eukprot:365096-Chlamydomonas_euryale.AAC.3
MERPPGQSRSLGQLRLSCGRLPRGGRVPQSGPAVAHARAACRRGGFCAGVAAADPAVVAVAAAAAADRGFGARIRNYRLPATKQRVAWRPQTWPPTLLPPLLARPSGTAATGGANWRQIRTGNGTGTLARRGGRRRCHRCRHRCSGAERQAHTGLGLPSQVLQDLAAPSLTPRAALHDRACAVQFSPGIHAESLLNLLDQLGRLQQRHGLELVNNLHGGVQAIDGLSHRNRRSSSTM